MEYCRCEERAGCATCDLLSPHIYNVYKKRPDRQFSYGWDNKTVSSPLDAYRTLMVSL